VGGRSCDGKREINFLPVKLANVQADMLSSRVCIFASAVILVVCCAFCEVS